MLLSNSGGVITRGLGIDARVITRGYGGQFEVYAPPTEKRFLEKFEIHIPLIHKEFHNLYINFPILKRDIKKFKIIQQIINIEGSSFEINTKVNNKYMKLIKKILEVI